MSRNDQKTVDSARADTCELCDQLDSKNNLCALYINFAGRSGTKLGAEGTQRRGRRYHACRVHPRFRAEVVGVTGTVFSQYSRSSATLERRASSERARFLKKGCNGVSGQVFSSEEDLSRDQSPQRHPRRPCGLVAPPRAAMDRCRCTRHRFGHSRQFGA